MLLWAQDRTGLHPLSTPPTAWPGLSLINYSANFQGLFPDLGGKVVGKPLNYSLRQEVVGDTLGRYCWRPCVPAPCHLLSVGPRSYTSESLHQQQPAFLFLSSSTSCTPGFGFTCSSRYAPLNCIATGWGEQLSQRFPLMTQLRAQRQRAPWAAPWAWSIPAADPGGSLHSAGFRAPLPKRVNRRT